MITAMGVRSIPFVISVYGGVTKPRSSNAFINKFFKEMLQIEEIGIIANNRKYSVDMGFAIFDSPARAFILCTKGHSRYNSRRIFVDTTAKLRTDKSFKNRTHQNYHKGNSKLELLKIGMVSQVPLDYLHVILLGVTTIFCFVWVKSHEKLDSYDITKKFTFRNGI